MHSLCTVAMRTFASFEFRLLQLVSDCAGCICPQISSLLLHGDAIFSDFVYFKYIMDSSVNYVIFS